MPPRPFPFTLSVGTDICHIARIRAILCRHHPQLAQKRDANIHRFLGHLLTPPERDTFWKTYGSPESVCTTTLDQAARHLGGRWAAKEATIKAVFWRSLTLGEVQVLNRGSFQSSAQADTEPRSVPYVLYAERPRPADDFSSDFWTEARVSISHDGEYATAVCLAAEQPEDGDVGGEAAARRHLTDPS